MTFIDPRTLAHTLAVAEQMHFGRAAQELYTSPSVISRSVKSLENTVGAPIFDRGPGREVEITARGRHVLAHLRRTLDALESLPSAGAGVEPGASVLRIGVLGVGLGEMWEPVRSTWAQRWPGVQLSYTPISTQNHDTAVLLGEVDLAIVQLTGAEEPELECLTTSTWSRAIVAHASSEFADADLLNPEDVADAPFLAADARGRLADWSDDLPIAEAPRDTVITDPGHVSTAVATTRRLSLHGMVGQDPWQTRHVRWVPLSGRPCRIGVTVRRDDQRPALRGLLDIIDLCHRTPENADAQM
ncbi:DNA-binding transcriptional LysR family regulator [Murinocardiopsis flavida]|uniref:DNA-binding transcriptional LysR family regulator n=1 Tax=Murinocardiopsis flavida TaxID=645275 RepID=A0A2P8CUT6_9ACTN|nr:LysR family transcriptional regulator [Murinocardiopsis flavida]PSK88741.1 DNA-binding transcriptional LysR family regulator [Murinocardiopsis flavida]